MVLIYGYETSKKKEKGKQRVKKYSSLTFKNLIQMVE